MNISTSENSIDQTPQPPRSKKLLAGMITSHILFVLLIIGLASLGAILMMLGGGLAWWNWIFFSPILMLVPIIVSWICYAMRNVKCASRLTYFIWGFFLLIGMVIGLMVLYTVLISSGP